MKNELLEQKWRKLLKRIWLFRFIPFVDFVFVSGSLATGNVSENSDFDVIVGARQGRIFTVRGLLWFLFGVLRWRRGGLTHKSEAKDKICLNHFVTSKSYKLKPPYNAYWQGLYRSLVPVFGEAEKINEFFRANDWLKPKREYIVRDPRHSSKGKLGIIKFFESGLFDWFWKFFENLQRSIQLKLIKSSVKTSLGYKPRIVYNDNELEFHPDTKRIEAMLAMERRKK